MFICGWWPWYVAFKWKMSSRASSYKSTLCDLGEFAKQDDFSEHKLFGHNEIQIDFAFIVIQSPTSRSLLAESQRWGAAGSSGERVNINLSNCFFEGQEGTFLLKTLLKLPFFLTAQRCFIRCDDGGKSLVHSNPVTPSLKLTPGEREKAGLYPIELF